MRSPQRRTLISTKDWKGEVAPSTRPKGHQYGIKEGEKIDKRRRPGIKLSGKSPPNASVNLRDALKRWPDWRNSSTNSIKVVNLI